MTDNVLRFLKLPPYTFEGEDQEMEEIDSDEEEDDVSI